MSEQDPTHELPEPDDGPQTRGLQAEADAPHARGPQPDPRDRPPDPAGTRPQWDPEELLPKRRAWLREPGEATDEDREFAPPEPAAVADAPPADRVESRFAPRFQFALGALLAVGAAAVALAALIAVGNGSSPSHRVSGPRWSSWHPAASAGDGPTQIAEHVAHEYRLPNGQQLVAVTGGPMEIAGLPLTVALRQPAAQGGDIQLIEGKGVLYRLCGLGPKCSIDEGKASTKRHLLLRREALELALYSFRYLSGVQEAVVFMPPRKGQEPSQALFFQKRDLQGSVNRPLSATLVPQTPTVGSVAQSPDATLVNTITTKMLFQFSFTQANQDARAFLVLEPVPGG